MNNIIRSWNIQVGDVRQLGSLDFSAEDLVSFRLEEVKAIKTLCKKVLDSKTGSFIATEAYKKEDAPLFFAVAFSESEGLCLSVNGEKHQVMTTKDVLRGRQGSFFQEIKMISAAAERQGIGMHLSETVCPLRDARIRTIFEKTAKVRVGEFKSTLLGRARAAFSDLLGCFTNGVSIARNSSRAILPAAFTPFGAMAILGGSLIAIAGVYITTSSVAAIGVAILHKSYEKGCLAYANIVAGLCVFGAGVAFMMMCGAHFAKRAAITAASGAVLPFFLFGVYVCGFATSVYKTFAIWNFRRELNRIIGQKDVDQGEKLYEALMWMRQKTHLSHLEDMEHCEKARLEGEDPLQRMSHALHEKWDKFALRAGGEAFEMIATLFDEESSSVLLDELKKGDSKAIDRASEIISKVSKKSGEQLFWNIVSAIYNIIGAAALIAYLVVSGPVGTVASSIIFTIAAFISLFIDVEFLRKVAVSLKDNFPIFVSSLIHVFMVYRSSNLTLEEALVLLVKKFRELKNKPCLESENSVQEEECQRSRTSSTLSDQSGGLPKTPPTPMEETSLLSQAS